MTTTDSPGDAAPADWLPEVEERRNSGEFVVVGELLDVGAVGIHHEDLVVPIPVTREGDAFAVR